MELSAENTFRDTKRIPWRMVCNQCGKVESGELDVWAELDEITAIDTDGVCSACDAERQARYAETIARHKADADAERKQKIHRLPEDLLFFDGQIGNRQLANAIWQHRDKCLFICGVYGSGKTRAAAANIKKLVDDGENARFCRWSDLAREYAEVCKSESEKSSEFIKELCKLDVLLIDDVGKRRLTETAGELLYDLLDKVYLGAANCRLWFTSNLTIAGLAERFAVKDVGSAFAARVDRLIDGGKMERLDA